jgi:hypothetical protein
MKAKSHNSSIPFSTRITWQSHGSACNPAVARTLTYTVPPTSPILPAEGSSQLAASGRMLSLTTGLDYTSTGPMTITAGCSNSLPLARFRCAMQYSHWIVACSSLATCSLLRGLTYLPLLLDSDLEQSCQWIGKRQLLTITAWVCGYRLRTCQAIMSGRRQQRRTKSQQTLPLQQSSLKAPTC